MVTVADIEAKMAAKLGGKFKIVADARQQVRELVQQGWKAAYTALFGESFVLALASHHIEAAEWHWESRIAFLENRRPEYLAYFPIWSRGHMKSSVAERLVVVDGILSYAYRSPGYCLYLSKNKDKVQEHIANVEALLASDRVRAVCPELSSPQRTEITNQQRKWTSSFLKTDANYSIQGGTLDSGLAGSRVEETRPTFIVPDDIDGREDSPIIAETRYRQLTTEVLPMRQNNTLVFFAQNLISRYSVMYRIQTGQARVLTNRKPTSPVPAVIDLVTKQETVDGIVKDIYVSGKPTWHIWDAQRIQDEIDTEGLESFQRECQHEVEQSKEGVILYNYNDDVHVITESEFASVYGERAYESWVKWMFNDWARTKTAKHANVAGYVTVSSQNTKLPGFVFVLHPMSFPANAAPEDVAERLLSALTPYAYQDQTWTQVRDDILQRANVAIHATTFTDRIAYERSHLANVMPRYTEPVLQRYNVQYGFMSHERDDIRAIYNLSYGLRFTGVNPKKHGGIEQMNRDMRVDYDKLHPFRPNEKGYTRFFIIVPDDKRAYREAIRPDDLHDWDLIRYQFKNWRYAPPTLTATGEKIDDPLKQDDDFGNGLQMVWTQNVFANVELTKEEKLILRMPEHLAEPQSDDAKVARNLWMQKEWMNQQKEEQRQSFRNPGTALDRFAKMRGK